MASRMQSCFAGRACGTHKKLRRTSRGSNDVCGEFAGGRPADAIGEKVLSWLGELERSLMPSLCTPRCLRAPASLLLARKCANSAPRGCTGARELPARTTPGRVTPGRSSQPHTANFPPVCPWNVSPQLVSLTRANEGTHHACSATQVR